MNLLKMIRIPAVVFVIFITACTATENDNTTNTYLVIQEIIGVSGNLDENEGGLQSDVCVNPGGVARVCGLIEDNARVTFVAQIKDTTRELSAVNDVVLDRYRVTYIRADGRNTPGVDVPFPFDGVTQVRVPATGSPTQRVVLAVRRQAKAESPLRELGQVGNNLIITTIAQIDFYGRDIAGREITVRGLLNVTFADFADE